jgi:phage-related protein
VAADRFPGRTTCRVCAVLTSVPWTTYRFRYILPTRRPIHWLGASLRDLRGLPERVRKIIGTELTLVQGGDLPTDWKPMRGVGPGVMEVRVHQPAAYRVLFVVKFAEAVYVLHVFCKKTRKTSDLDLAIARRRYAELLAFRAQGT